MTDFIAPQAPIDYEIANALIIATPEMWQTAKMTCWRRAGALTTFLR
ncbi:hypothetical protein [Burkholderia ubonensis]|nr:hypothetical protein [Burkholderia ubonensis]